MKYGFDSAGIDANPASHFVALAKTTWNIHPDRLLELLDAVELAYYEFRDRPEKADKTFEYLSASGMLERGWISVAPLLRILAIKRSIRQLRTTRPYKNALMLALLHTFVRRASNVKFGPELYCATPRRNVHIIREFAQRVKIMVADLRTVQRLGPLPNRARVIAGDARDCSVLSGELGPQSFSHVICSPPYPAEHDYTRNSRLELALLESVRDRNTLRAIKRTMVRSHTKGIYQDDDDASHVNGLRDLYSLADQIDARASQKNHGFAKLYSRVMREYFGGMARHLTKLHCVLADRAILAYVVGDQSSYLQVQIPTAQILGQVAARCGYRVVEVRHWRTRPTQSSHKTIGEHVLLLQRV
jgi:hypothetical protein